MKYCPLISFHKEYRGETECMGDDCMFTNETTGKCLIAEYLLMQVNPFHNLISIPDGIGLPDPKEVLYD